MDTIRLSLDAILAIPDKLWLVSMYEDTSIENYEEGRTQAQWIDENAPNTFILIEQYGHVDAVCGGKKPGHWDCWHYDPHYALYLVPLKVWEACKADVMGIQAEYVHKHRECKADPTIDYEAEERDRRRRDDEIPF